MAITRQPTVPKVKLPGANIYLDDLEEIINILKPDGEDQPRTLAFTVNDLICDNIDDLRKIGGRTSIFKMELHWKTDYASDELRFAPGDRAYLRIGGSVKRKVWSTGQIYELFKRRVTWLGRFQRSVMFVFCLLALLFFEVCDHFVGKVTKVEGISWVVVLVVGWPMGSILFRTWTRCERSSLLLQTYSEEEGSWFKRHHDQIILAAVTSLISASIGAAIALFVQKIAR